MAGVLLALVAVGFLIATVADSWDEVSAALEQADPAWVVASIALAALGMTLIALGWWRTIAALGGSASPGRTVLRYYVGEIGKYLPGSLWPLIGRGELAARAGVGRSVSYSSVAISLIALYLAAGLFVLAAMPFLADADVPLWPLLAVPVGLALLAGGVLDRLRRVGERTLKRPIEVDFPTPRVSAGLVAVYLPAWLAIGTATWAMTRALVPDAAFWPIVAAAVLSWLGGFVAVPVPGGIGVREAIFVAAAPDLPSGIAAAVAIAIRLVFVVVDGGGWAIGSAVLSVDARADRAPTTEAGTDMNAGTGTDTDDDPMAGAG